MKQNQFKVLIVIAVITAMISAFAVTAYADDRAVYTSGECGAEGDNLTWVLYNDGELVIEGAGAMADWSSSADRPWNQYRSEITKVTISSGVTNIGVHAFWDFSNITSVELPATVTKIGNGAFSDCTSLTNIEIPASVTYIDHNAFNSCTSLTSIEISEGVRGIGNAVFIGCAALTSIEVAEENTAFVSVDGVLFSKDMLSIVVYPAGKTETSYKVPDGVIRVDFYAFASCSNLTSIELPASLSGVGYYVFNGCTALTVIEVAEGNTAYVDVDGVLFTKDMKTLVQYPEGKTVTSYKIPEGVTNIRYEAFIKCTSLTSIEFPEGLTSIESQAFVLCSSLTSIEIPASVTNVGNGAFRYCSKLASVTVLSKTTEFERTVVFGGCAADLTIYGAEGSTAQAYAADNNHKFEVIRLVMASGECGADGDNLTWTLYDNGELVISGIGAMADWNTNGAPWSSYRSEISKVTIESGVTSIGNYAFYAASVTSAEIADSVKRIGSCAFFQCDLTSIKLPSGLESLGDAAFVGCASEILTIPSSLTTIDNGAFDRCEIGECVVDAENTAYTAVDGVVFTKDMKTLVLYPAAKATDNYIVPTGVEAIAEYAFNSAQLKTVTLPNTVLTIDSMAFAWSDIAEITIPASVTLSDKAFLYCNSLKSISVDAANAVYTDVDGVLFTKDMKKLLLYPAKKDSASYIMPEGVVEVVSGALEYASMTSMTLPATLTTFTIGSNDLWYLEEFIVNEANTVYKSVDGVLFTKDMKSLLSYPMRKTGDTYTVPDGVTTIGQYAFMYGSLKEITFPLSVTSFGRSAIFGYLNLEKITVYNYAAEFNASAIGNIANTATFYGHANSTAQSYASCNGYNFVALSAAVITSGNCGANGENLTWTLYDNGELVIKGTGAMADYSAETPAPWIDHASDISEITIENGVTSIGAYAFSGITSLEAAEIPVSVTSINDKAFYGCAALAEVKVLSKTAEFGTDVFGNTANNLVLHGYAGSTAEAYAESNEIEFSAIKKIVYVGKGGTGDGTTPEAPMGDLVAAFEAIGDEDGTIVFVNMYDHGMQHTIEPHAGHITLTSKYNGVDYKGGIYASQTAHLVLGGDTTFENMSITVAKSTWLIRARFNHVTFGENVKIEKEGNPDALSGLYLVGADQGAGSTCDHSKDTHITLKSGNFTEVIGGSRSNNNGDLTGKVIIEISGDTRIGKLAFGTRSLPNAVNLNTALVILDGGVIDYWVSTGDKKTTGFLGDVQVVLTENFDISKSFNTAGSRTTGPDANGYTVFNGLSGTSAFVECISATLFAETQLFIHSSIYDEVTATDKINKDSFTDIIKYSEDNIIDNGTSDLFWYITGNGTLVISGEGAMPDYSEGSAPWAGYADAIKSVKVCDGITYIGDNAFNVGAELAKAEIYATAAEFGDNVFGTVGEEFEFYGFYESTAVEYARKNKLDIFFIEPPVENDAENVIASGICGEGGAKNLIWAMYKDGTLEIYGNGSMKNFEKANGKPWQKFREMIERVAVREGVTSIGDYAFYGLKNLKEVSMPKGKAPSTTFSRVSSDSESGIESIGMYAFGECEAIEQIAIPVSVTTLGENVFSGCEALEKVTVLSSVVELPDDIGIPESAAIVAPAGSPAQEYAEENGRSFVEFKELAFASASLTLYNDISVNFKVKKADLDASGYTDPYAVFEFNGEEIIVSEYTMATNGNGEELYVFTFDSLAPHMMNDIINATLVAKLSGTEYESNSIDYSVSRYCYNHLSETTVPEFRTLLVDLLNYGAEAQLYNDYNVDSLVTADLTEEQRSWATAEDRELVTVTEISEGEGYAEENAKAVWKSASLYLENDITVRMKFVADDISGMKVKVDMGERSVWIEEFKLGTDGRYVASFDSFDATQMSQSIKATVYDADGNVASLTLTYSVESYAANKANDASVGSLVKAMMKYGDSAAAYREALGN